MARKIDVDKGRLNDQEVMALYTTNPDEFSAYVRGRAAIYESNLRKIRRKRTKKATLGLTEVPDSNNTEKIV